MFREGKKVWEGSGEPGGAEGAGGAQLEKRKLRKDLLTLHKSLQEGLSPCSCGTRDRTRGHSLKLHQGRFILVIRKISS